jgi:hypothetical protein
VNLRQPLARNSMERLQKAAYGVSYAAVCVFVTVKMHHAWVCYGLEHVTYQHFSRGGFGLQKRVLFTRTGLALENSYARVLLFVLWRPRTRRIQERDVTLSSRWTERLRLRFSFLQVIWCRLYTVWFVTHQSTKMPLLWKLNSLSYI